MVWLPLYLIGGLLPVVGAFLPDSPLKFDLQAAGNIWLGFWMYYAAVLVLLTALHGLVRFLAVRRGSPGTGWYGWVLTLSVAVSLAVGCYGLIHAQKPKVVTYDLSVNKQVEGARSLKIVLVGDLHLSANSRLALTEHMVERINQQKPDMVLVAGDVFTSSYRALRHPEQYARTLGEIRAKHGVYAVYGNHDVEEGLFGGFAVSPPEMAIRSQEMERFFRDSNFITLEDEVVTFPGGVQLAGRIDGLKAGNGTKRRAEALELLSGVEKNQPVIVLEHEPREFSELAEAGADLILCGHTHDGQVFPGNLLVPYLNENGWGYKRTQGADTIVTAGVGYYGPPMRVGTNSEITVINLKLHTKKHADKR
jgi:predicted MPP superfamily phosphohydrolase